MSSILTVCKAIFGGVTRYIRNTYIFIYYCCKYVRDTRLISIQKFSNRMNDGLTLEEQLQILSDIGDRSNTTLAMAARPEQPNDFIILLICKDTNRLIKEYKVCKDGVFAVNSPDIGSAVIPYDG